MSSSLISSRLSKSHLRGAASSIMISAIFALIWGINGSLALPGVWRFIGLVVVVLITAALAGLVFKFQRQVPSAPANSGKPMPNPFLTMSYRVSLVAMIIAFPVAARILTANNRDDAIMSAVVIIVGLHFLGLVSAFRNGIFAWVAGAFCVLGVVALFLPVLVRTPVLGLGCALILWIGITPLTLQTLRHREETA